MICATVQGLRLGARSMIRTFLRDNRGNYALMTVFAMIPIMGAVALAVDYAEISRQREATRNALDAAGIATARRLVEGATDTQLKAYALDFFKANLGPVDAAKTSLTVTLPTTTEGGGTLKLEASLRYDPYFLPVAAALIGKAGSATDINFSTKSEVRLKNTLEVALVLDNSGSMDFIGSGTGQRRMVLLQQAATTLVEDIAKQAGMMTQIERPVQFGLVPFAGSVNVGPGNATANWMDTDGLSPIHYENFTLPATIGVNKEIKSVSGAVTKSGTGWGTDQGKRFTRFSLYDDIKVYSNALMTKTKAATAWQGCVEARPSPYNTQDKAPDTAHPETFFVPMFAPDEWDKTGSNSSINNWWSDNVALPTNANAPTRQHDLAKYYNVVGAYNSTLPSGKGPQYSCTTAAITQLTDVSNIAGLTSIKTAISTMVASGATNVPEGLAWGWRVLSHGSPFTQGRPETEKGNDKIVILLTDGANTYYPQSFFNVTDLTASKSSYSAYGYAGQKAPGAADTRIFSDMPNTFTKTDHSEANYTRAMNIHMSKTCDNAKAGNIIIMTVALDLNPTVGTTAEKVATQSQIDGLKACASESRFRKDDAGKPEKLFFNTTSGDLAATFKKIADELSNLRIIG